MDLEEEDDLLGLLDDEPQPSSKRALSPQYGAPAKKRRKERAGSGSDMDMSDESSDLEAPSIPNKRAAPGVRSAPAAKEIDFASDEDESEEEASPETLYPYRGIYKDREDYKRLQEMNEVDREEELGSRQEEVQAFKDRQKLKQMVANRDAEVEGGRGERKKTQTGRTEAKASALEKLRKTRKSKAARATGGDDDDDDYGGTTRRRRPKDYSDEEYTSDEDVPAKGRRKGREVKHVERMNQENLKDILLPRWRFAHAWTMPWFEDFIKGAWVRISMGPKNPGDKVNWYKLAEVAGVEKERAELPYMLEGQPCDVVLRLRIGKDDRLFTMQHISGLESEPVFKPDEYTDLLRKTESEGIDLPTLKDAENKLTVIKKYKAFINDEASLQYSINQKKDLQKRHGPQLRKLEIEIARHEAKAKEDWATVARLDTEMKEIQQRIAQVKIAASQAAQAAAGGDEAPAPPPLPTPVKSEPHRDALAAVNERNRLANRQAIRKAELAGRVKGGSEAAVLDPSARVKTTVRLLHDVSASQNGSRAATPQPISQPGSPIKQNGASGAGPGVRLEQQIASKVEVDLGDF